MNNFNFDPSHFFVIAGPCVAESKDLCQEVAEELLRIKNELKIQVIFKASFLKANRSSHASPRGPGIDKGLEILKEVREKTGLPLLTDIHESYEIEQVSQVVQFLQIPAFLCRQTALLEKAGQSGLWVNIKKGQFMAPWDMKNVVEKVKSTGNSKVLLTERGSSFGYNNLVVDYRGMKQMLRDGHDLIFDATHSVQLPSAQGQSSGGDRTLAPALAYSAAAMGVKGFFIETHPTPNEALSDGPNSLFLKDLSPVLQNLQQIISLNILS